MSKKKSKKGEKSEKNALFFVTYYSKNQYKIIFLYYNRVNNEFKFFV
jgi:hypothetical protein